MRTISLLFHDVYVADPRESGFATSGADRYKLPVKDFDAQLAGLAGVRTDAPQLIVDMTGEPQVWGEPCQARPADLTRSAPPSFVNGRVDASVPRADDGNQDDVGIPYLFTVDDGGMSYYTLVADRLEERGWRGHCFVSTDAIGTRGFLGAGQIRELDRRGHVIGSHSASHPARFSSCAPSHMIEEWTRSRKVLEDLLGHEVRTASLPGGYYSPAAARSARDAGLHVIFTSEPTTAAHDEAGILVVGRYTVRRQHATDRAGRLAAPSPWTRYREWAGWQAKGLVKPVLGPLYSPTADWILSRVART
jgi:peptidoglycan/xylan/chitin deacetylase (PgdA/CDA1 family)